MDQVTYVCEEFQDSKSTFIISDFKIFRKMFLWQLHFGVLLVWQLFYVCYKEKTPFFFNLSFLLLISQRGLRLHIYTTRFEIYRLLWMLWMRKYWIKKVMFGKFWKLLLRARLKRSVIWWKSFQNYKIISRSFKEKSFDY